ncbi:MAG: hypothetical protein IPK39_23165 [Sulfuritalea sp.]|nr:hypothetical protein [Sulfuritalea sp.]
MAFSATTVQQAGADTIMTSTRLAMNGVVFEAQTGADLQYPATFARDEWEREQTTSAVGSVQRVVNTTGRQDFGGGEGAPYFVSSASLSARHELVLSLRYMNEWERKQAEATGNYDDHWTVRRKRQ